MFGLFVDVVVAFGGRLVRMQRNVVRIPQMCAHAHTHTYFDDDLMHRRSSACCHHSCISSAYTVHSSAVRSYCFLVQPFGASALAEQLAIHEQSWRTRNKNVASAEMPANESRKTMMQFFVNIIEGCVGCHTAESSSRAVCVSFQVFGRFCVCVCACAVTHFPHRDGNTKPGASVFRLSWI